MTVGNCLMCGDKLKYYDSVRRIVRTKSRKSRWIIVPRYQFVPSALGIRQVQKAQAFNLMADGHRMIGLAKTYDAKATAIAMKTVVSEVL